MSADPFDVSQLADPFAVPPNRVNDSDQQSLRTKLLELKIAGWPEHLIKAFEDPFIYAAHIKNLGIVVFESAEPSGHGWVRIGGIKQHDQVQALPFIFDRGVDVRLCDIRWVADAPNGS